LHFLLRVKCIIDCTVILQIGEYLEQSGLQANDNTDSSQESSAPMLSGGYGSSSCSVPHSPSVHKQALQSSPPLVVLQNMNRNIMADDSSQTGIIAHCCCCCLLTTCRRLRLNM